MKHLIVIIGLLLCGKHSNSQQKYWVEFRDRGETPKVKGYTLKETQEGQVYQPYLDSLQCLKIEVINTSKWLNSVSSKLTDSDIKLLQCKSFVKSVSPVHALKSVGRLAHSPRDINYGFLFNQINSSAFKKAGLSGKNVVIGIMDTGFADADEDQILRHVFDNDKVREAKDFVDPSNNNFYKGMNSPAERHGVYVWRMIAGKDSQHKETIGLSSDAVFYLARTDNGGKESRIEEDNWISALEWFHSKGVKIVNSSIAYSLDFDNSKENHNALEMDGKTTAITRAAQAAAEKGLIIIVAAGNDGDNKKWRVISAPADAQNVISVGSTDEHNLRSSYSGIGTPSLSYIKPNVSCYSVAIGTSFTAPVITGIIGAMLERDPSLDLAKIASILEASSSLYPFPNDFMGYGVPDCERILKLIEDPNHDFKRSEIKEAEKSIVLEDDDVDAIAFHKKDKQHVIKQVVINRADGKLTISRLSKAIYTTVILKNKVIEIHWK